MTGRSIAIAALLVAFGGTAYGGETHEFWPELQFDKWFDERRSRAAEIYFDTQYNQMSRYRLILGVTLPIYEHFSVEPFLVRQVDNAGGFTITNAIGLTLITSF